MLKTSVMVLALFISLHSPAFAAADKKAEGQSSLTIEEAADQKNVVKSGDKDVDEVITNKKMRAEAGSKSKHSLNGTLNYSGSTVQKPFAEDRPNLRGRKDATAYASINGTAAYKYAVTKQDAVKAGVGLRWITPFSGSDTPDKFKGDKNDFDDPYLQYQRVYKWGPAVQSVLTVGPTLYTRTDIRKNGSYSNIGISQNNAVEIGSSGLTLGLLVGASATQFDKNTTMAKENQDDYEFGIYPFAEYVINDTFNVRTIVGWRTFSHPRSEPRFFTFRKDTTYQSLGIGISVNRDIFLYPNVQFVPGDIRDDRTNVALSTNINVF